MKRNVMWVALVMFAACSVALAGQKFEINNGIHTAETATEARACELFKKLVEERSGGNITVNNFPGAVLGTELENLGQLKSGELQMTILGAVGPQQIIPEYDATNLPFAFPSVQAVEEYWNGPIGDKIKALMIERNKARLIGMIRRGPRHLTANKAITSPAGLSGLKLRIPEIASWVTVWKGMGALPTPVNWSEAYTALQTKVVDAQENPIESIYTAKINEVQTHVMLTGHLYLHFFLVFNEDFFKTMPADYQKIVLDAAKEAVEWGNKTGAEVEGKMLQELKAGGMTVVEVDKKPFMDAARDGVLQAAKTLTPEALEVVMGYMKR